MSYLYVKWNSFGVVCSPAIYSLKHVLTSVGHSRTKACDAVGGAFRPQWREWPGRDYWVSLVRAGTLAKAAVCNICITSDLPIIARNHNVRLLCVHPLRRLRYLRAAFSASPSFVLLVARWPSS